MRAEDMVILSIDDHVVEPPNMFDAHIPAKYAGQAPKLVRRPDGFEEWRFEGRPIGVMGMNATVTWPKHEWGFNPTALAEMRPGAYDIHDRVRDMNRNGIFASMCFPTFAGFSGRMFQDAEDKDLALAVLKAYNDWHIDEWCGAYTDRFIPNAIPPIWDPQALADEVRRVAAKGCHAISMPELPHIQNLPSYRESYWDPFFTACCDEGVIMNLHIGQGIAAINMPADMTYDIFMVLATQVSVLSVQDLLWGPAMRKYPDLKIAWSEGGIGWIPFMLDRCDRHYETQRWTGQDFGTKKPSEVFREHALACFIADPTTMKLYKEIGVELLAFEADYPHSDCIWPNAPEMLLAQCDGAGCSDEDIELISWANVARFVGFDPFARTPRAEATVGALRAKAADVDTSITSKLEFRARYDEKPRYDIELVAV